MSFRLRKRRHPRPAPARERGGDLATIVICNYNYGRFLAASIDSALAQTYGPTEIVVVDDGSTDESRDVLESYRGRVKIILKPNGGQASALNTGIARSRGEFVFLLDSDDVFDAGKLARIVPLYQRNPDLGWIFHELDYIDGDGRLLSLSALPDQEDAALTLRRRARFPAVSLLDFRAAFCEGRKLPYSCPALSALSFRRAALDALMPIPEDIAAATDEFPKYAALALFPGAHVNEALARQRVHGANAATAASAPRTAHAARYLKTAYHLRRRFAHVAPSTDKWFANSFGTLLGSLGPSRALATQESRLYLSRYFGPATWLRQAPRIAYHAARHRLARSQTRP